MNEGRHLPRPRFVEREKGFYKMTKSPLISIIAMTYCQERYVKPMVNGLLDQDYENLEVVISDDCSSDATYEIVCSTIREHAETGHRIILNRNDCNLGFARHFEKILSLTHGELIVANGGDDISDFNRVSRIVAEWERGGREACVVCHGAREIDCEGRELGVSCVSDPFYPLGAMMAYSRRIVDEFPRISVPGAFEDDVYSYRAMMIGTALVIPEELISYRVGSGITSMGRVKTSRVKVARGCLQSNLQLRKDIDAISLAQRNPVRYKIVKKQIEDHYAHYKDVLTMFTSANPISRFVATRHCMKTSSLGRVFLTYVLNLLPSALADSFREVKRRYKMAKNVH